VHTHRIELQSTLVFSYRLSCLRLRLRLRLRYPPSTRALLYTATLTQKEWGKSIKNSLSCPYVDEVLFPPKTAVCCHDRHLTLSRASAACEACVRASPTQKESSKSVKNSLSYASCRRRQNVHLRRDWRGSVIVQYDRLEVSRISQRYGL